jgi:hypothetical protein
MQLQLEWGMCDVLTEPQSLGDKLWNVKNTGMYHDEAQRFYTMYFVTVLTWLAVFN